MTFPKTFRRLWPVILGFAACAWALFAFDWPAIGAILLRFDIWRFLLYGIPLAMVVFVARTARWVAVAGLPFTGAALWRTHLQTALSIATAIPTPLAVGEALKLRFAREETGAGWAPLGAAYLMERVADVAALTGLAAIGLAVRGSGAVLVTIGFLLLVLAVASAPAVLRALATRLPPGRLASALAPLADLRPGAARLLVFGTGTILKWVGVVALWNLALSCASVVLSAADTALLIAAVTLSVTVSLVPAGIGVAEVTTRALLVWMGAPPGPAEAGAVALRLLSPLMIGLGLLHGLPLLRSRKAQHGRG